MTAVVLQSTSAKGIVGSERRISSRSETKRIGSILLNNGDIEKCMICNISIGGAEIIRYFVDDLPMVFKIQIDDNLLVPAKVVWNKGMHYGINFCI